VEGDPIAVSVAVTLPAQPAVGRVTYIPLGGDGKMSPIAAYSVVGVGVTGAAGGGSALMTVTMDDRYSSLIQYVSWSNDQVARADADFRTRIATPIRLTPILSDSGLQTSISSSIASATVSRTWAPPPVILGGGSSPGFLEHAMLNVADDEYLLNAMVFLFDIRVRELTPMGPLLWARGST